MLLSCVGVGVCSCVLTVVVGNWLLLVFVVVHVLCVVVHRCVLLFADCNVLVCVACCWLLVVGCCLLCVVVCCLLCGWCSRAVLLAGVACCLLFVGSCCLS